MAKIKYTPGIDSITGAFSKDGIVQRLYFIEENNSTCTVEN